MSKSILPNIILVLGMHRSGTSLIAHLIAKMGINLGDDLMEANEYNPDGYWESNALVELHERMLKFTGNEWYAPINPIDTSLLHEKFGDDAQKLIASMDEQAKDWCWKDPRMSIFLDFWKQCFKSRDVLYITVVRHPKAVAASLLKRDNIPIQVGYALFEIYNKKIIASLEDEKNQLKINYDEMLSESYDLQAFQDKLQGFVGSANQLHKIPAHEIIKKSLNHAEQGFHAKLPPSLIDFLNTIGFKTTQPTAEREFNAHNSSLQLLTLFKAYYSPQIKINFLQIYYADTLDGFNEEDSEIIELKEIIGITEFQIVLPKACQFIRIDPLNDYVVIRLPKVSFLNEQNQITQCNLIHNNAFSISNNEYAFDTTDPQMVFESPKNEFTNINFIISLEYINHGAIVLPELLGKYREYKNLSNQQREEIVRLNLETSILTDEKDQVRDKLENIHNQLTEFKQLLKQVEAAKEELTHIVSERENQIMLFQKEIEDLKINILQNNIKISSLQSNLGYRLYQKLSALFQKLKKGSAVKALLSKYRFYKDKKKVLASGYMDVNWYLNQYPDVSQNGVDPVWHYLHMGYLENRNPGPIFSTSSYLDDYPDVAHACINPLLHYVKYGSKEGRSVKQLSGFLANHPLIPTHSNMVKKFGGNLIKRLQIKIDLEVLRRTRLFDSQYYLHNYPDVKASGMSPARHYYHHGWQEGRNPSIDFDTSFYLQQYPDVNMSGMNPLLHYLRFGKKERRSPMPKSSDDPHSIVKKTRINNLKVVKLYKKIIQRIVLLKDLKLLRQSAHFDKEYYLRHNPDVKAAGVDPVVHYYFHGWKEGRDPSKDFDNHFYLNTYHDVRASNLNPLLHYVKYGHKEGRTTKNKHVLAFNNQQELSPAAYESPDQTPLLSRILPVKLIAFYLPQFHPIPENDTWWGKGFTEWTKVTRAKAYFEGHNQPNLPTDLGFYDLRVPDVMSQQIEMAKTFGISAFCFHYYWFGGKRLLEKPLNMFLEHKEWDVEFCICWANENWTRRWDGHDKEILLAQDHSPEDDIAFIEAASVYLLDRRYIRINNKPVLIIYRPQLFHDMKETAQRWQKYFYEKHGIGLFIAMVQTFGKFDPTEYGLDGAIEFPPHNIVPQNLTQEYKFKDFKGNIFNALTFIENKNNKVKNATYKLFRGLMLNWDNTPRKGILGNVYVNNTPENYGIWLNEAIEDTIKNKELDQEKLVFINAWNEWAEGTHLEPNQKYGYSYLNMTKKILNNHLKNAKRTFHTERPYTISVIIPNYNHAKFLKNRIWSILNQTHLPNEIVFLDDASDDESVLIAENLLKKSNIPYKIIKNDVNSKSVFSQWIKGLENANGDLIWIAESDDSADPGFLSQIIPSFDFRDVLIAYGDISYININDTPNNDLSTYYDELTAGQWESSHTKSAYKLFSQDFAMKNIIPNVSGAVFRKPVLTSEEIERLKKYKFTGDWYFYSLISRGGSISYCKQAKSYFRYTPQSVSRTNLKTKRHVEEHRMLLNDLNKLYSLDKHILAKHAFLLQKITTPGVKKLLVDYTRLVDLLTPKTKKDALNVCIASYSFSIGGGELVPIILANSLRNYGYNVTFLVYRQSNFGEPPSLYSQLRNDIPIVFWKECNTFNEVFAEFGIDLINSHNIIFEYQLFLNKIKIDIPYVVTLHGSYENTSSLVDESFIAYINNLVSIWLPVAEKNKNFLIENGLQNGRFTNIFNALPKSEPTEGSQNPIKLIRAKTKYSFIIVLASRAIITKGWDIAIEVVKKLKTKSDIIQLVLIGDGEDFKTLKKLAEGYEFIHFIGRIDNAQSIINECDLAIFPSTYQGESFPLFLLESLSAGLPVVATDVGEIKKMLTADNGQVAGTIIPCYAEKNRIVDEMANAIERFLNNRHHVEEVKSIAKLRSEYYSIGRLTDVYHEQFKSACTFPNLTKTVVSSNFDIEGTQIQGVKSKRNKTLYIHIGLHKTGTSSIQLFLHQNRDTLLANNSLYYMPIPTDDNVKLQHRFLNKLMLHDENKFLSYFVENLHMANNFIISSECFIEKQDYCERLSKLKNIYDRIVVIVGLRRQDHWLESLYRFRVTNKHEKRPTYTFENWIEKMKAGPFEWHNANYTNIIEDWSKHFNLENIVILPYQDDLQNFNIVEDFNKIVGLQNSINLRTKLYVNQSPTNREFIEFHRLTNDILTPDQQKWLLPKLQFSENENLSFLSIEMREEIINHFKQVNLEISKKFNGNVPLFNNDIIHSPEWVPFAGLSIHNKEVIEKYISRLGKNLTS